MKLQPPESPFRAQFKAALPSWYRGELHVLWTLLILTLGIGLGFWKLASHPMWAAGQDELAGSGWTSWHFTFFALAFFGFAQLFEYGLHRWILHIRRPGFFALYKKHTLEHHRFFTDTDSHYTESRDIALVLFPMWAPLLCVVVFGMLMLGLESFGLGLHGALLLALASAYFLFYETLHFFHHLPERHLIFRIPGLGRLRRNHTVHHDPSLMQTKNFGVTLPIFDFLFGTKI